METVKLIPPSRGFATAEFENRTNRLQALMAAQDIGALFVTTEPEFRYFSGFKSQFWESPTRPWFLVIPANGKPIAVVPEIGVVGFEQTWIENVRSWPRPARKMMASVFWLTRLKLRLAAVRKSAS